MIISASRRTDIPALYGDWFLNRLETGWCLVPNPFNPHQISRVSLLPDDVDAFVFWTRDPTPFWPVLDLLDRRGDLYLFLITLTGYGRPLEPAAPDQARVVAAFHRLAERLGPDRVVWRYDPIVLGGELTVAHHLDHFQQLTLQLQGATTTVKISFVDLYHKTRRRLLQLPDGADYLQDPVTSPQLEDLVRSLVRIAGGAGLRLETCAEQHELAQLGARPGSCIDGQLLRRLSGRPLPIHKDSGQRQHCRCVPSKDIGMNDTCVNGCAYCYATRSHDLARRNHRRHDPGAPSLLPIRP